ncbi:MAG TPA: FAD-dependent monooxygenase [Polyangia bacterium]|nr:FAD-dependent monooxygenase [Polyangia bacterium]
MSHDPLATPAPPAPSDPIRRGPAAFDYDVAIAGAGPAGVATAVALVRRDPSLRGRVLLLDRAGFPRDKPCGGGLTGHAHEALAALGLELVVPSFPSPRAEVRYGGLRREVRLGRPVRVIRREAFDASLVQQARDLGVVVREHTPLNGFTVEQGGVTLGLPAGAARARVLVGADGAGSQVRKHLVGHRQGPLRPAIRLFRAEVPARGRTADAMLYDFTLMREGLRGYLWIFPVPGDRLNVGLMHYPAGGRAAFSGAELVALLRAGLAEHGIALGDKDQDAGALRGWPAWGYQPSTTVAAPHLLVVGDAAGIDALTGEGIAVGMEQGMVAARAILAALTSGDFGFAGYRRALRRATVGRELALDRWLARMLYDGDDYRRWLALVLLDAKMLEFYAARVSGTLVLADHKRYLMAALGRHLWHGRARYRQLEEAIAEAAPPTALKSGVNG